MNNLVEIKKNKVFTNSKIIADGTENKHEAVQKIISKYSSDIEDFGALRFEMRVLKHENYRGSTREKVYYLNEEQATFVITLLRNSKVVVKFKKELVRQFYSMRQFLLERQSKLWTDTRQFCKENRLKETDIIKQLADCAKDQGSSNSDKLYLVYSKLAKTVVKNKRDELTVNELNTLNLVESIILQTIQIDMSMDMDYKQIYQDCKNRINQFKDLLYLTNAN